MDSFYFSATQHYRYVYFSLEIPGKLVFPKLSWDVIMKTTVLYYVYYKLLQWARQWEVWKSLSF